MALKYKISKADYEKLTKPIQAEYKLEGEDATLEVEGVETGDAAVRAKNEEKKQRQAAEKRVKDLEAELKEITDERDGMLAGTIPKVDMEKMKTNYETKIAKLTKDMTEAVGARDSQLQALTVDNVATSIAGKLFVNSTVGMPHVKNRLRSEFKDGKMVTIVLDKAGQPSDMTPEQLEKELASNEDFKPILASSRGSGSGANGNQRGGGAGSGAKSVDRASFDAMTQNERSTFSKSGGTVTD